MEIDPPHQVTFIRNTYLRVRLEESYRFFKFKNSVFEESRKRCLRCRITRKSQSIIQSPALVNNPDLGGWDVDDVVRMLCIPTGELTAECFASRLCACVHD